jgi:hypothetical protein
MVISWIVTPCNLVDDTKVSEEPDTSIFRVEKYSELEAIGSPETLVPIYQITRRHIPEHRRHRRQNLASHERNRFSDIQLSYKLVK